MKRAWIAIALAGAGLAWLLVPRPRPLRALVIFGVDSLAVDTVHDESPRIVLVPSEPSARRERRATPPPPPAPPSAPLVLVPEAPDSAYFEPPSAFDVAPYAHAGLPDWVPPRPPAPTTPPKRVYQPESRVLEGERNLTPALLGARRIADAIAAAVRLEAPAVSSGTFVVHVDADGRVLSVKVTSHGDGRLSTWKRIATESARSLAGARFDLQAPLSGGALVTVSVTSNLERPSGTGRERRFPQPRSFEGPRWPWAPTPGPRLSWREEGSWTPLPPDMARTCPNPETTLPPCDPAEPLCPKFRFDVADIGARRARIVRTHIDVAPVSEDGRDALR